MENAAVIVIVAVVIAYLIRRGIQNHKNGTGCTSCSSCPWSGQCSKTSETGEEQSE